MTEFLYGTPGSDNLSAYYSGDYVIFGLAGADVLRGGNGNDRLFGGRGPDTLYATSGVDYLLGGPGNDTYVIQGPFQTGAVFQIIEEQDAGTDLIKINAVLVTFYMPDNVERVEVNSTVSFFWGNEAGNLIDARKVVAPMSIFGLEGNDTIYGGSSWDLIDGGPGADEMIGGAGIDTYYVDNRHDVVTEDPANTDSDQVISTVSYRLGAGVESLALLGSARAAVGNELDNILNGNGQNNVLRGLDGVDYLTGRNGNDRLVGGAGDDLLLGGRGSDILYGSGGQDIFVFLSYLDTGTTASTADDIRDFEPGDVIDLTAVDADTTTPGEQLFSFVGHSGFSGTAGELRYGGGFLRGDLDGDGKADFFIKVDGSLFDIENGLLI